jgi:adenylate cyclase
LRVALSAGVPLEALLEINRVIGRSMAAVAGAARDALGALLGQSGGPAVDKPLEAAKAAEVLAPELERVLTYAYREHARELVRHEAGASLLAAGEGQDVREVAIAFADLVGFTGLSEQMALGDIGRAAEELDSLAGASLRPNVRIVKTIGDEVMLASEDPPALVETVLDLLARNENSYLPPLRAGGAAGPALHRAGDWYGQTVNLGSRLTDLAEPGTLLADEALRERAPDAANWIERGSRSVRGLESEVALYEAR